MKEQTILIVDDEMVFVESLKKHFLGKEDKYDIKVAFNGVEALDIIGNHKIDLVILDLNMPVLDGIEVLVELYNRGKWLPIIVLTSIIIISPEKERNIFEAFGIVEYMEKPVNLERLDKRVAEALKRCVEYNKPTSYTGLSTILRVIENEKRTGVLTVKFDRKTGRIFFRDGDVIDAEANGIAAEDAFFACLKPGKEETKISLEYIRHQREKRIEKSLSEMLPGMA
ncbi:MAG: response regulator, partial [Candidatus Aminicenantes bacterium]|nr:response regulator [Candidatus Aminicenantes bacterium]